jgi:hypothetical protein
MWALRILSGSQIGHIYQLKQGRSLIGRAQHCTIRLENNNVSKEHAIIEIDKTEKQIIYYNNSRNGTFVNGTKIKKMSLKKNDKIAFHDVFCDIVPLPNQKMAIAHKNQSLQKQPVPAIYQSSGANALSHSIPQSQGLSPAVLNMGIDPYLNAAIQNALPVDTPASARPIDERNKYQKYLEEVLLPGIYKLTEMMEFKLVVGLFLLIYAFLLTALSTIPMIAISSESIQIESRRRALTIARNLATLNQQALLQENESALNTSLAEIEEGVSNVYIISQANGSVIAPASKSGAIPSFSFIETARREQKEFVQQIDSSHIGVSVPLSAYNPETGGFNIKALAIVIYDMGSLAVEDGRTVSLFMQVLCIAIALGFILYFLFNKLIEYPILSLNREIDNALKTKQESTNFTIEFPLFEKLISNVNTLLSRVAHIKDDVHGGFIVNKEIEASNLLHMLGYASLALTKEFNIIGINPAFEAMLNVSDASLKNQPISLIPDQALQKNIIELIQKSEQDLSGIQLSELEFGGVNSQVSCMPISDDKGVAYFVVSIVPLSGGG